MTFNESIQAGQQALQDAASAHEQVVQDNLTLKAENDALRRQLADCEQGQPTTSFDAKLARVTDGGLRLRAYDPDVPLDPANLPPEIRKMDKGTTVICWAAKLAGTGIFQDTSFIPPEAALQFPFDARYTEATNTVHVWMLVDDLQSGDRGWCAAAWLAPVDAPAPPDEPDDTPVPDPGPEPEPITGYPIGSHILRFGMAQVDDLIRSQQKVILGDVAHNTAEGGAALKAYLEGVPDGIAIIRDTREDIYVTVNDVFWGHMHPERMWEYGAVGADMWRDFVLPTYIEWNLTPEQRQRVYLMAVCEQDKPQPPEEGYLPGGVGAGPHTPERRAMMEKHNEFELRRMKHCHATGFHACILNFAEGNPEPGELIYAKPAIVNAHYGGDKVGMHVYVQDAALDATGKPVPHGYLDPAYAYRYKDFRAVFATWPEQPDPGFVVTELGPTQGYFGAGAIPMPRWLEILDIIAVRYKQDGVLACDFGRSPWPGPWDKWDIGREPENKQFTDHIAMRNGVL